MDELLCGFTKEIELYNKFYKITSIGYFNPNKSITIEKLGLPNQNSNYHGNLILHFPIHYKDDDKMTKFSEIFCKIFKVPPQEPKETYSVQSLI